MIELLQAVLRRTVAPLERLRARRTAVVIGEHLRAGESVLDVGCGTLAIGKEILKYKPLRWTGVDTVDYHEPGLDFKLYDGRRLPYVDESFDTVLLSCVLHHCNDPLAVIDDCARVARVRLIIIEDTLRSNALSLPLAKINCWIGNTIAESGIQLPYSFRKPEEWREAFHGRGLEIERERQFKSQPIALVAQTLFVVGKGAAQGR